MRGLGALLFDDGLCFSGMRVVHDLTPCAGPPQASQGATIKGMYTHQNADLLVASKIEQQRTKEIAQVSSFSQEPKLNRLTRCSAEKAAEIEKISFS
jgi:hypothetical protein